MRNYADYEQFCPRCRTRGIIRSRDGIVYYPCGSVFDGSKGEFRTINCEFRRISSIEALQEAEVVLDVLLNSKIEHTGEKSWDKPRFHEGQIKNLLWDADTLQAVLNNADSFMGTRLLSTKVMHQVWVIDPAFITADKNMVIGTQFFADDRILGMIQLLQPLQGWPNVAPFSRWGYPYYWGDVITNYEQAQAAAVYTWLQQPYVTQEPAVQHSRQVRREAERKGKSLSNISVIQFRKPIKSTVRGIEHTSNRELHCCFERTGFTRRQPCGPKNSLRKVVWVAPTIVGNPEMPFKPKGGKLYRVSK